MQYVIGDVHGCNKTLNSLLLKLKLNQADSLYFVGDLIDRGPDSKGVIDTIFEYAEKLKEVKCCRGNHEQLMFDSVKSKKDLEAWLRNGGDVTMKSFGIPSYFELPDKYKSFFLQMPFYIELEKAIIVHAGFGFENEDFLADTHSMLWTRNHVCDLVKTGNKTIIHGHTPVTIQSTLDMISDGKGDINIDTGCIYTDRDGMGRLTAINLNDMQLTSVDNKENN